MLMVDLANPIFQQPRKFCRSNRKIKINSNLLSNEWNEEETNCGPGVGYCHNRIYGDQDPA
jgi:hypothetical protein